MKKAAKGAKIESWVKTTGMLAWFEDFFVLFPVAVCSPQSLTREALAVMGTQAAVPFGTQRGGCGSSQCGSRAGLHGALPHTHTTCLSCLVSEHHHCHQALTRSDPPGPRTPYPKAWDPDALPTFDQQEWKPEGPSFSAHPSGWTAGICSLS